jgi:hypothetical protein
MFFWFSNDTFSIIDALTKLILVIAGSVLIICFCHRLTNFKKTRRYKYDFIRAGAGQATLANQDGVNGHTNGQFRPLQSAVRWPDSSGPEAARGCHPIDLNPSIASALATTYDPYNTIRPVGFGCANSVGIGTHPFQQSALSQHALNAYGYHHPGAALVAFQSLAAPGQLNQQQQPPPEVLAGIYSTSVRPDCSGFRAHQLNPVVASGSTDEQDACPSYEEATRATQPPADQQQPANVQDGSQSSDICAGGSEHDDARDEPAATEGATTASEQ